VANPFDQFDSGPHSGPVFGLPLHPPPQTPDQAQGQQLQNTHTQQTIAAQPLQNENTAVNIQQGQASIHNQQFNQNQGLRQEFNNLPEVKNYSVALQSLGTALKAPDTPQGDLSIIYAYAKAADPGSVVREGEMDMATATASLPQKYQADLARLTQGKRLPPEVRTGLIETMRQSVSGLRQVYDQQRSRYGAVAQQQGIPPDQVLGQPLYDAYRPLEEQYIRDHGGTPQDPNAPQQEQAPAAPTQTERGFGIKPSGSTPTQSSEDFRNQLFTAMKSKQVKSPADIEAFQSQYNQSHGTDWRVDTKNPDTRRALAAALGGRPFNIDQPTPYIGNAPQGSGPSFVRGAADTVTVGLRDKIVAAGDALQNNSPLDYNLARQYAVSDADQKNNPFARLGGQALGGAALPMGEVNSLGNLALKGAAYGGAYGLDSSRSVGDIPANVLGGAAAGAAVPAVLGKVFKPKSGMIDPLVDPVTGELNTPLDSMNPAQRLAVMHDYGMKTVTPGMVGGRTARVLEQGLNNVPGSAGVMEDVNKAASGEVRRVMQGVAQQFGSSKTMNEGGSQIQSAALARNDRAEGVIGKAYQAIPIADTANTSKANTVGLLQQLTGRFQSNQKLAEAMHDPKLSQYLDAFQGGDVSWQDMKAFRSAIGEKIGEMRFGESSSTSDLRALYGALSQDMRDTASSQGPKALRAFERANTLNRQNEQLIQNSLTRILGKDGNMTPEQAAGAVQAMTKGGKAGGDLKTLAQIKGATVKSGAWDEIASTLIHLGGQPANSEGRAFNPQTFVNWYADMAEPARSMLFKPEQRKALDGFVSMVQQLGRVKGLTNTSNTTPTMIGSGVIAAGGLAAISHPMAILGLLGAGGANYGMAKLWTNPAFVRLVTGLGRASLSPSQNAVQSQAGRLARFAATNPEFSEPVQAILRHIANDNFVGTVAASPGPDQKQQQQ
jgi:hypothetical protein